MMLDRHNYIGLTREALAKRHENQSRLQQTNGTLLLHTLANFFCLFVLASSSGAPLSDATPISKFTSQRQFYTSKSSKAHLMRQVSFWAFIIFDVNFTIFR